MRSNYDQHDVINQLHQYTKYDLYIQKIDCANTSCVSSQGNNVRTAVTMPAT